MRCVSVIASYVSIVMETVQLITVHSIKLFMFCDIEGILPKGPTRHAYAWQIGPFWQDTLDICMIALYNRVLHWGGKGDVSLWRPSQYHIVYPHKNFAST